MKHINKSEFRTFSEYYYYITHSSEHNAVLANRKLKALSEEERSPWFKAEKEIFIAERKKWKALKRRKQKKITVCTKTLKEIIEAGVSEDFLFDAIIRNKEGISSENARKIAGGNQRLKLNTKSFAKFNKEINEEILKNKR